MPTARMTPLGMFIGSGAGRHDRSAELPRGIEQQRVEITHVEPRRHAVPATPDTILARG